MNATEILASAKRTHCGSCGQQTPLQARAALAEPDYPMDLILTSVLAAGDAVVLSAAIRDLHRCYEGCFRTHVITCDDSMLFDAAPWQTPRADLDEPEPLDLHYPAVKRSNQRQLHFLVGYIEYLNEMLGLKIRLTEFRGDLHLTDDERAMRPMPEPYWLLLAGGKRDYSAKTWPAARWQTVVDMLKSRIAFVQAGHVEHQHPALRDVVDVRSQTNLRQLAQLVYHSEGVACGVTGAMHMAAAFNKPCVVVAGGREPPWWEAYTRANRDATLRHFDPDYPRLGTQADDMIEHRFLDTIGRLDCCKRRGCWRSKVLDGEPRERCPHLHDDGDGQIYPECLSLIEPEDVAEAITSYALAPAPVPAPCVTLGRSTIRNPQSAIRNRLHVLANMICRGGGEYSTLELMRRLRTRSEHEIHFWPLTPINPSWRVEVFNACDRVHRKWTEIDIAETDHVLIYANDWPYKLQGADADVWRARLENAASVQIVLNFVCGPIPKQHWLAKNLTGVYFLSSSLEAGWKNAVAAGPLADVPTSVLPPPTDLEPFFAIDHSAIRNPQSAIVIGRLGGSAHKLPPDAAAWYRAQAERLPGAQFWFMPAPPDLAREFADDPQFRFLARDEIPVAEFLAASDIFLYPVSPRVKDQGPRVVMEAMAAGCAVLTEPRDGCLDRIEHNVTGLHAAWPAAMEIVLHELVKDAPLRARLGAAARDHARTWTPDAWADQIIAYAAAPATPQMRAPAPARPNPPPPGAKTSRIALAYSFHGPHRKHFGAQGYYDLPAAEHWEMLRAARRRHNPDSRYREILSAVALQDDVPNDLARAMTIVNIDAEPGWQQGAMDAIRQALETAATLAADWLLFTAEDILPLSLDFVSSLVATAQEHEADWCGQHHSSGICTQVFAARVASFVDARGACIIPPKPGHGGCETFILNWLRESGRSWHFAPSKRYAHERDLAAMAARVLTLEQEAACA